MTFSPGTRQPSRLPDAGRRYALVIATSAYHESLSALRSPRADAAAMAAMLADPSLGGCTVTRRDDLPAREFKLAIATFLRERRPDDTVLLYLSGHGLVEEQHDPSAQLYFAARDTVKDQMSSTGVPSTFVIAELGHCRAKRQILVVDSCFSAAFHPGGKGDAEVNAPSLLKAALDRSAVPEGRGRVVLTSSGANQLSYEGDHVPGGDPSLSVFTEALLHGVRSGAADRDHDGLISVNEAFDHASERLAASGAHQRPQMWVFGGEGKLILALSHEVTPATIPDEILAGLNNRQLPIRIGAVRALVAWASDGDPAKVLAATIELRSMAEHERPEMKQVIDSALLLLGTVVQPHPVWSTLAAQALRVARAVRGWVRALPERWRRLGPRLRWQSMAGPVAVTLAVGLLCSADLGGAAQASCGFPPVVGIVASPEMAGLAHTLTAAYERSTAAANDGCRTSRLYVTEQGSADVLEALRQADAAPSPGGASTARYSLEPDVWLTESAEEAIGLAAARTRDTVPRVPLGISPIVLGVVSSKVGPDAPQPNGRDPQAAGKPALRWADLLDRASRPIGSNGGYGDWGGVIRPNPKESVTGELATVGLYGLLAGGEPTAPGSSAVLRERELERGLRSAQDRGHYPLGDVGTILCYQLTKAARFAIVLSERALIEYNTTGPRSGTCARDAPPTPENRLVAFYPGDTPVLTPQAIQLRRSDRTQNPARFAAAGDFLSWLRSGPGRQVLQLAGLRSADGGTVQPLPARQGIRAQWPFAAPTAPAALDDAGRLVLRQQMAAASRSAKVALALDLSGSMTTPTSGRNANRFTVAVDGVERLLGSIGTADQFGLLVFSGQPGMKPVRQIRQIAPLTPLQPAAVAADLRRLWPNGDTPLYRAIAESAQVVRAAPGEPDDLRAVVVLTDGRDTSKPRPAAIEVPTGVRVFVLAIGEASCADQLLSDVTEGSDGDCVEVRSVDLVGAELVRMFDRLWGEDGR
ncbi:hypothetical protein Cs7R123_57110 [Catellatospora sp. TT07R-123]|uniref:caspase family protein n=1 Tax=Catellatospora sp. TT07R-123 TaxID=2733863 RepID=UPI001B1A01E9|nr:caspase family protein [Catellatospora sp. TT07R-123]GHJ48369.1 hypothetical protein Cs7R123_57110 [Catellatospora sp. TT07R-123]